MEFTYDGQSRMRIKRDYTWLAGAWASAGETRYLYDGMQIVQERSGNVPSITYARGRDLSGSLSGAGGIGGLLARSSGYSSGTGAWSTQHFYHADGNGNITALVDSSQALAAVYDYDPYGRTISASGSLAAANRYRFSSKAFHANTGMDYYGYRFYDPYLQRWLNRDPIGEEGGGNLYRFVSNNPLRWLDPSGLRTFGCGGWLCVSSKCRPGLLANVTYIPEDPPVGLHNLPPPGSCVEADAVYYPRGAVKMSDFTKATVECDEEGNVSRISAGSAFWPAPPRGTPPSLPLRRWLAANIPPYRYVPPGEPEPPRGPITVDPPPPPAPPPGISV